MSKRKLTEVEKAYIEKVYSTISPLKIAKELGSGVGERTVEKYIEEYKSNTKEVVPDSVPDTSVAEIKGKRDESSFGVENQFAHHDRGGVTIITQGASEFLDEFVNKKVTTHDYRGKMAKIRKDKPGPKDTLLD